MRIRRLIALVFSAVALCCASVTVQAQTVIFVSDINGRYGSTSYHDRLASAMARVDELAPDLVVSTGDLVAGQRRPPLSAEQLDAMWAELDRSVYEPLATAGIEMLVTPGNHDGSAFPAFEPERKRFVAQWKPRAPDSGLVTGSDWPLRYGYWLDDVLLLAFDSTIPGAVKSADFEFVRSALEENAAKARHVVVFTHLPMWPIASGREKEIVNDSEFLALLHEHGVSAYVSGHHHAYFAGRDDHGMLHLAVGALGGNSRNYASRENRQPHSFATLNLSGDTLQARSYMSPDFMRPVPGSALPSIVHGPLGDLRRLD